MIDQQRQKPKTNLKTLEAEEQATRRPELSLEPARLELLHSQIGNLAVQELLGQLHDLPAAGEAADPETLVQMVPEIDPAAPPVPLPGEEASPPETDPAEVATEPVEIGTVLLQEPEIDYYDLTADNLAQALEQSQERANWLEQSYEYDLTIEDGRVVEANITVTTKIWNPRWTGPGWDQASPEEQGQWLAAQADFEIGDETRETSTELPPTFLLGPAWETAPPPVRTEWRTGLQADQAEEEGWPDRSRRRATVLQQRLINQPERAVAAIFSQFLEDIRAEETEYARHQPPGQAGPVSISGRALVQ